MKKIDIEQKYLDKILEILRKYLPGENVIFYIFGSRIKGSAKKYSDIDIAIDYNCQKIDDLIKVKIETDFEDSTIPYKIDVVDLNDITEDFKKCILNDLVRI